MTTRSSVARFLEQKRLVLAGVSRGGKKVGNSILKDLTRKGYEITVIHPEAPEIDGHPCSPTLADLPAPVGGLILVVPPDQTEHLVREAHAVGIENIWMQQGAESPDAITFCHDNGINLVHGECVMMFAQPTGIHKFHRWVRGLRGKLPKD